MSFEVPVRVEPEDKTHCGNCPARSKVHALCCAFNQALSFDSCPKGKEKRYRRLQECINYQSGHKPSVSPPP